MSLHFGCRAPDFIEQVTANSLPPRVAICHGGTYITSDNFPAQKNRCQDGVKICTGSTPVRDNQAGISKQLVPFFFSSTDSFLINSTFFYFSTRQINFISSYHIVWIQPTVFSLETFWAHPIKGKF